MTLARRERPCLIIEDVPTACETSLRFCRDLRAHPTTRSIPLILVTAPEARDRAREAHADAMLEKPVVRRELFDAVKRFVTLPRRRTLRLATNLRFSFHVDDHVGQAFSRDISTSGVFLKTDRIAPLGTRVELRFRVPGAWEDLCCHAVVRNTVQADQAGHRGGMGLEFEDLSDHDRELLETFIDRHVDRPLLLRGG
jgi:uncharacterized protein (TIGR02266 family)